VDPVVHNRTLKITVRSLEATTPTAVSPASELGVLVTGMHRSGTSALAGALLAAGLQGGSASELESLPVAPNPAGYAERRSLVAFNDRLLRSLGWRWDTPPFDTTWPASIDEAVVAEGRRLVEPLIGHVSWCFKDPRLSLLLPWWRRILLDRFVVVVSVRPAEEISWSLTLRDGFSRELGRALTAGYYRHLAVGSEGLPVVLVDYVALAERPTEVLSGVFDGLRSLGVVGPLNAAAAAASVRRTLRRATQPVSVGGQPAMPDSVDRAMEAWSGGTVRVAERFEIEMPPPEPWEIHAVTLHRVDLVRDQLLSQEQTPELATELTGLRDAVAQADADRTRHVNEEASLQGRLAAAETELDQREQELATLQAILAATEAERDQRTSDELDMRTSWAAAEGERERLATEAVRLTSELSAARVCLEAAEAETRRLRSALAEVHAQLESQRSRFVAERQALMVEGRKRSADLDATRVRLRELQGRKDEQIRLLILERDEAARRAGALAFLARRRTLKARLVAGLTRLPLPGWIAAYPLFDGSWYQATYPDVASTRTGPYIHWRRHGIAEQRNPNPFFDVDWYLRQYPDVTSRGMDAATHYLRFGAREGRDPSPSFKTSWYVAQNPDVEVGGLNPLVHYLRHGRAEGRAPKRAEPRSPVAAGAIAPQGPAPSWAPTAGGAEARARTSAAFPRNTTLFSAPSTALDGNGNGNGNGNGHGSGNGHAPAAPDVKADRSTA
jgi:hypothetical protein